MSVKDRRPTGFYDDKLTFDEQVALSYARDMEGIDEEIALLRVKLRALAEDPKELAQYLKSMQMLVKAVGATERLRKKSQQDLFDSVMGVLESTGVAVPVEPTAD